MEELDNLKEILSEKEVRLSPSTLYVVATPIGRLVDLSVRAVKTLEQADLIAAEDTRRSFILLNALGLKKEVVSNQKFNEHRKTEFFLSALRDGKSVAVISDAGTPCISDPGNALVKAALAEGFEVIPVPGACAAVSGACVSGFDLTSFLFCGFFPKENSEKKEELARLKSGAAKTYIYYESPKRIRKTMAFLSEHLPDAKTCLCNDLTKTHEKFYRGTAREISEKLESYENAEKGEYTLILEAPSLPVSPAPEAPLSPEAALAEEILSGGSVRDAMERILSREDNRFKKNELKAAAIALKNAFSE